MTHQPRGQFARIHADAGHQIAQLRNVLALVEELAGRNASADLGLTEAAEISSAHANALPIVQRRFDALAAETAGWSAAALEALLKAGGSASPAAAGTLADELDRTLAELTKMLPR